MFTTQLHTDSRTPIGDLLGKQQAPELRGARSSRSIERYGSFPDSIARDKRLSLAATALLAFRYVFTGNWGTRLHHANRAFKDGLRRHVFKRAVREINSAALWTRTQERRGKRGPAKEVLHVKPRRGHAQRVEKGWFDNRTFTYDELAVFL